MYSQMWFTTPGKRHEGPRKKNPQSHKSELRIKDCEDERAHPSTARPPRRFSVLSDGGWVQFFLLCRGGKPEGIPRSERFPWKPSEGRTLSFHKVTFMKGPGCYPCPTSPDSAEASPGGRTPDTQDHHLGLVAWAGAGYDSAYEKWISDSISSEQRQH